jgi:multiple sugar transport system ATP-binding protein
MIAGFESATSGEILVNGGSVTQKPPTERGIGLVFQDYAVFSRMTVRQNLSFGLESRPIAATERRRRVEAMAEKFQLSAVLERRGRDLNMSEMQRVALGRVLLVEPALILLDEPMSNLDAGFRAKLRGELKGIQRELGQTVLYVTHDQAEAMSMSDRIAIMHRGVIQQVGTPDEIYDRPANLFVAEFIGDPPINLMECQVRRSGAGAAATVLGRTTEFRDMPWSDSAAIMAAIRPHDVHVSLEPVSDCAPGVIRFAENLGPELVLHVECGGALVRAVAAPDFAAEGETVYLDYSAGCLHLVRGDSGEILHASESRP